MSDSWNKERLRRQLDQTHERLARIRERCEREVKDRTDPFDPTRMLAKAILAEIGARP